jgi:hypothetical protein
MIHGDESIFNTFVVYVSIGDEINTNEMIIKTETLNHCSFYTCTNLPITLDLESQFSRKIAH